MTIPDSDVSTATKEDIVAVGLDNNTLAVHAAATKNVEMAAAASNLVKQRMNERSEHILADVDHKINQP